MTVLIDDGKRNYGANECLHGNMLGCLVDVSLLPQICTLVTMAQIITHTHKPQLILL